MTLPERIGRYEVLGLLGQGAMGTVYRARDANLDRDVALKVMSGGHGDETARKRFESEARAAARLQHPNIVTIYELGTFGDAPFMALELLEGVDLQRAIEAGLRPDPKRTLPVVLQLLSGLAHAHEKGIVHRDVKPSNVFLPRGRPAKIMDFGIARLTDGLTAAGIVVGTPNYMSPEQVQGATLDGRSDLFSAGLILYELVTGEKAFRGDTVVALLFKIAHQEPDLGLLPQGPQWSGLRAVLTQALAREPDARYPDARHMIAELERALLQLGGSPQWAQAADAFPLRRGVARGVAEEPTRPPEPPTAAASSLPAAPAPVPTPRPHTTLWLAGGFLTAAVLVVAGAVFVTGRSGGLKDAGRAPASSSPAQASPAAAPTTITPSPRESPAAVASPAASPPVTPATALPRTSPAPTPPAATPSAATAVETPAPQPAPENARLERAEDLFDQGRYAQAMAEAKAVLIRDPRNSRAKGLVEDAEVEILVLNQIREAQAALKRGDREAALEALKPALAAKPSDSRLLGLWKEATRE